jgi:hypothetical protein
MESDNAKRSKESGLRERRYAIRYPFTADAEMFDLKSGIRLSGVTSDLSLGGCFVCVRRTLAVRERARLTLTRKDEKVMTLAVVRVVKPGTEMGLELPDLAPNSNKTLLGWVEGLRHSR